MTSLRIESVDEPFRSDRVLAELALRLLTRAEYVSALPAAPEHLVLDGELVRAVGKCLAQAHMPTARWALLDARADSPAAWREAVAAMNEQIEMSPLPDGEWAPAIATLGDDLLAQLLDVSVSSVRRYGANSRATPQRVAERLHVIALVLADLAGSYNNYGIRRWFTRPRAALRGKSAANVLGGGFDPDGKPARQVQQLAADLIANSAA